MPMRTDGSARINVRMLEDKAADARKTADRLACEAWNERMRRLGGPAVPSPSIGAAINGGFPLLEVVCRGCRSHAAIELPRLRRRLTVPVHTLEGSLACQRCADDRGRRRSRSTVVALHTEQPAYFEAWWPDQERDRD